MRAKCLFATILILFTIIAASAQDGGDMRYVEPAKVTSRDVGKWVHLDFGKPSGILGGSIDTMSLEKYDGENIIFVEHRVDDGLNNWFKDQYLESTSTIDGLKVRWTKNKLLEINDTSITVQAYFDYMTPTGNPFLGRSYSKKLSFPKSTIAEVLIYDSGFSKDPQEISLVPFPSPTTGSIKLQFWDQTCKKGLTGITITGTGPERIEKTQTDTDGEVEFKNLKPGLYKVSAEKNGFVQLVVNDIPVTAGMQYRNTFEMRESYVFDGEEPTQRKSDRCKSER